MVALAKSGLKPLKMVSNTIVESSGEFSLTALQDRLKRVGSAGTQTYSVPTPKNDLFRLDIRCYKRLKEEDDDISDLPDLEDAYHTDLPWAGYTTFRGASRQFRSKNLLALSIGVVREIDGYLWHLCVQAEASRSNKEDLAVVKIPSKSSKKTPIIVEYDLSSEEQHAHFSNAPTVPMSLTNELFQLGYQMRYVDNDAVIFYIPMFDDIISSIHVSLFGKVIRIG